MRVAFDGPILAYYVREGKGRGRQSCLERDLPP